MMANTIAWLLGVHSTMKQKQLNIKYQIHNNEINQQAKQNSKTVV